jgi:hypothetical protein
MSINVNKITSVLAKLQDFELQQYAQMHKNDPYIMSLAVHESNRRKDVRNAEQGAMQEQPKVADQMLAEMAPRPAQPMPEDQGIGQLNAGEMNFAGGGIIAFADGGDVERYQVGGSIQSKYQQESQEMVSGNRVQYSPDVAAYAQQLSAQESAARNAAENTFLKAEQQRMLQGPYAAPAVSQRPTMVNDPRLDTPRPIDDSFRRQTDPRMLGTAATPPTRPLITSDAAPAADTKPTGPRPAPTDKAAAKLPGTADLAMLYQDILGKQSYQDPAAAGLLELESRERAAAAADRQAIERDAERFKDAYKGREGRLAEREADIGKQKGTNTGLAFLNAGLAIMSTPGGLATAIGKGAQVGTAQFASGLDKIRSAQERLAEARDRLDDLKLNREETTAKELRAAENNYRRVGIEAQKRTIDGVRQAAGVNEARAKDIYSKTVDMTKTVYEQEQANRRNDRAVAASNRTPAEIQMVERIMKEKNIPFSEALASLTATKREPVSQEKLRADWLDPAKRMQIAQDYPNIKTFDDYALVMGAGTGGGAGGFKVVGVR